MQLYLDYSILQWFNVVLKGSAVIAGIQVTELYHRSLHFTDLSKICWLQAVRSNVPHIDWSQLNNLVEKWSSYAVSYLSHTGVQSKYILPPNQSSSSFKPQSVSKNEVDNSISASKLQRQPIDALESHNTGVNSSHASEKQVNIYSVLIIFIFLRSLLLLAS